MLLKILLLKFVRKILFRGLVEIDVRVDANRTCQL
jgi:hypothetical protein